MNDEEGELGYQNNEDVVDKEYMVDDQKEQTEERKAKRI